MRAYETVGAKAPDHLLGAVRGRLTRERVLSTIDAESRTDYDTRLRRAAQRTN